MTKTHNYEARAYREEDGWWTVEVPELTSPGPGGTTIMAMGTAVTTRGLDRAARELVAAWLDVAEADVNVTVRVEVPADVVRLWEQGAQTEQEGRATVERAAALRREAIRTLRDQGYTVEAAALALGISRQRVQQLANAS